MNYAIFDTESTGFSGKDEVIQFSCFLTDDKFNLLNLYHFHCYTTVKSHAQALKVHGLTPEILMKLSGNKTFEDQFFELEELINAKDICWVGANVSFDKRMVNQTLTNNKLPRFNFGKEIKRLNKTNGIYNFDIMGAVCSLKYGGIKKKLSQMVNDLQEMPLSKIDAMYANIVAKSNGTLRSGFHDANYDAFCTWALLYEYGKKFR